MFIYNRTEACTNREVYVKTMYLARLGKRFKKKKKKKKKKKNLQNPIMAIWPY